MPNPRMKHRRVVHKSTAGILKPIPEAVDLVGNPPPGLTTHTVALLQQRVNANCRSLFMCDATSAPHRSQRTQEIDRSLEGSGFRAEDKGAEVGDANIFQTLNLVLYGRGITN